MDNRPIGLLDSGVGGLSVLKKVIKKLPNESTIFIGDQANMPYGDKSRQEVIALTRRMVKFLLNRNVKLIIFACNTATAAAMSIIQREIAPQIIGVIQSGSLAAARTTKNKKVAVIATTVTVNSHAYSKDIKFRDPEIKVTELATPKLAPLVEAQEDYATNLRVVQESLKDLQHQDFDTLVLGCTHYPLIEDEISQTVGKRIQIVDPADQVAQYTANVLKRDQLESGSRARHEYFTSGAPDEFTRVARQWLKDQRIISEYARMGE